jgi:hypothetical protein
MIGYLANLAVPRLGEVLKCTILAKYEKVPAEKIIGTIVAERVFDVLCLGIIFLLALILQFDVVTGSYQHVKSLRAPHPGRTHVNHQTGSDTCDSSCHCYLCDTPDRYKKMAHTDR